MILVLATLLAQTPGLTPHQRQACAPFLAIPNADPRETQACLDNARQAEEQAAMLDRMSAASVPAAPAPHALPAPTQDAEALRRQQYAVAEEERRLRLVKLSAADDPAVMQVVLSAKLCDARSERADTLAKIAEEHKYARRVGVVNLGDLEDLKQELRDDDEKSASLVGALRGIHRQALRCGDRRISAIRRCVDDPEADGCDADGAKVRVTLYRDN